MTRSLEALLETTDDLLVQAALSRLRRSVETLARLLRHAKEETVDLSPGQAASMVDPK
jgi:DNA invertase Pin-like site-specific DNA recombinase